MMKFECIGFCEDLDLLSCGLGEKDVAVRQTEPDPVVEDDISFDEFDVDELERRMWRDKERLKRLKEQTRIKEERDEGKQRQSSQEQARDKVRLKRLTEQIKAKERTDEVKHRQSQEQARRKKMSRA